MAQHELYNFGESNDHDNPLLKHILKGMNLTKESQEEQAQKIKKALEEKAKREQLFQEGKQGEINFPNKLS